jgi:predicted unusual protein kinase regulating ubiquinone biosynthesis (AarF/ABC1/UbiB family)
MGTERDNFNQEAFAQEIKMIVEAREGTSVEELKVGDLVMEVTKACGDHGLRIPDAVFMIGKMLLNLDIIGKTLDPTFNPDASIRRHIGDLARKRLDEHLSIGNVVSYLTDMKELFAETPGRVNKVLENVADNKIHLKVDAIDEQALLKGFHRVANRITVGLILAALIMGASMLMNIESKFTLFGYPGLAMVFFLTAAVGGLILVFRILIGSEK